MKIKGEVWVDVGLLLARVGFGGTLIFKHGLTKIPELLVGAVQFPDPLGLGPALSLWLALFAEVVCALAIVIGLYSRWAAIPLVINFAVIVLVMHEAQVPHDRGELALLYLLAFGVLLLTGPGRYSLDHRRRMRRQEPLEAV